MKANKINIDDFINDTITELQKHKNGVYLMAHFKDIKELSKTETKKRVINAILKGNGKYCFDLWDLIPLLKDSTEYLAKYKAFFNSNNLYINEIGTKGTKGKIIHVFLFDGRFYSLCDYVSNKVEFCVYGTTSLNVNNKDNHICVEAFNNATIYAHYCRKLETRNNVTVYAYDSTQVNAHGNETIFAYDSVTVNAFYYAKVYAYDKAKVTTRYATVYAYDNTIVYAYKGSNVYAHDSVTVNARECEFVQALNSAQIYSQSADVLNIYDNTNLINCDKNTMINAYGSANIISVKSDNIKADENVNISFFDNIEEKHISNYNIYELEYNDIKIVRNWYYKNETNKDYIIFLCNNEIPHYHAMGEEYNKRRKRNITEFNYNTI